MFSFWQKSALFFLILAEFIFGYLMLQSQGLVISNLTASSGLPSSWPWLVIGMVVFQMISLFANSVNANLREIFGARELGRFWKANFPLRITMGQFKDNDAFLAFCDQYPRWYQLVLNQKALFYLIAVVSTLYMTKTVIDRYWLGLSYLPILLISSWASGRYLESTSHNQIKTWNTTRAGLMEWIKIFLNKNKEIVSVWQHSPIYSTWVRDKINPLAKSQYNLAMTQFKRNLLRIILVEGPYWLCIALTFVALSIGILKIQDAFIWFGITQYLVQATRGVSEVRALRPEITALKDLWTFCLHQRESNNKVLSPTTEMSPSSAPISFALRDGTLIHIPESQGIVHISGTNGSGKSTLVDTISGWSEEGFKYWNAMDLHALRMELSQNSLFIDKDPAIFDEFDNLWSQILGPRFSTIDPELFIQERIYENLDLRTANKVLEQLQSLHLFLESRTPKTYSSGEKVLISVLRAIVAIGPEIKAIVVDEADAPLDKSKRDLLQEILIELSRKFKVLIISHIQLQKIQNTSVLTEVLSLACDDEGIEGFVIPIRMKATPKKSNKPSREAFGNVARSVLPILNLLTKILSEDSAYNWLEHYDLEIESSVGGYEVDETESIGLVLAAGLEDLRRQLFNLIPLGRVAATGHVLLDGRVKPVRGLLAKINAATKSINKVDRFFTYEDISNIRDLQSVN